MLPILQSSGTETVVLIGGAIVLVIFAIWFLNSFLRGYNEARGYSQGEE